jgi:hypothetical protein
VIATSLLLVVGVGSVLVLCLDITPVSIWKLLFGSGFQTAAGQNISHLLAIYAMTTIVYSLSVVIITFEMSYKISNTSWVQLVFSAVVIGAICRFHSSLEKVILVQLTVMGGLFVFVALPFLVESLTKEERLVPAQNHWRVRATRAVSEDEVIAEIVRSDFHSPAYEAFQQRLSDIVNRPNLNNTAENAKRRALLFLRHCALWQEIPAGTKWHEIEVGDSDLKQIRAFPRAHWRTIASGELSIVEIALAILTHRYVMEGQFLSKISSIRDQLREEKAMFSAVILIGRNERDPLTVLDGNHRLLAAMLASPTRIKRLRFLCGFSPRMKECCWYNTNVANLLRYGTHVLARLVRNPEAEFRRSLEDRNSDHSVARVYDLGDQSYIADSDNLRSWKSASKDGPERVSIWQSK